jgi:hypothetical protein
MPDAANGSATPDAPVITGSGLLGQITSVQDGVACPAGLSGTTCKRVTVAGCPGIETESMSATIMILPANSSVAARGTIMHFIGGGGDGVENTGMNEYAAAGFEQVFVSWDVDQAQTNPGWEVTHGSGIRTAACRPATVIQWIFDDLHGGRRDLAFCGQGHSGGTAQLGYSLTHYGLGNILDYVNELSGPPFVRLDLGCNADTPPASVCGTEVPMLLPDKVATWENMTTTCPAQGLAASELARLNADSVAVGGTYKFPQTQVEFFNCTYHTTANTGMAQLLYNEIVQAGQDPSLVGFHCYAQSDGCMGEGLGAQGEADAIHAMIEGCTPRHQ